MKAILFFAFIALALVWVGVFVLGMVSLVFSSTLAKGIYLSCIALAIGGFVGWLKLKLG